MPPRPKPVPQGASTPTAPPPRAPIQWRRHLIPLAVLWTMVLAPYANSFRDGLIYDNSLVVKQDTRVHQATAENLHLIFSKQYWYKINVSALYRPLATLSYLFNYAVLNEGASPAGYHAINLLLHAADVTLVYWLGWLLFAEFRPAFAMAAIMAVHPVLTESVTNIVGRADLLAAFGVLAALLCYVRSLTARGREAALWQAGVLLSSAIAIFSKESGIVAIAVIFLYDLAWRPQAPRRARVIGYLATAIPVLVFLMVRSQVLGDEPLTVTQITDNPLFGADFWTARLTAIKVLGKYLWLLIWPARLSCDYSFNQIPLFSWKLASWEDLQAILSLAIYLGAAALAWVSLRRWKPLFFSIGFYLVTLAPTANIFLLIGTIMAERTLYLPAVGFAGCVAWGGWKAYQWLLPRWPAVRLAAPVALAAVCLALAARTFVRNFDWYDDVSLWTSAERVSPNSYRTHQHLAAALMQQRVKDYDAADRHADRSLAILAPLPLVDRVAVAYATAGMVYRTTGEAPSPRGGAAWLHKAIDVLLEGKQSDIAWDREFNRRNALVGKTIGPAHYDQVYLQLSAAYRDLHEYQNSLDALNPIYWSDPEAEFFEEASATFVNMGEPKQAAIALLDGIAMQVANQPRLAAEVVDLYRKTAAGSCALEGQGDKAAINFSCPEVRQELCLAHKNSAGFYRQLHRDQDAAALVQSAITGLGCPAELFR